MTKRKAPRDAGMYRDISAAIGQCHAWLNDNAAPPAVLDALGPDERAMTLENCRKDPRLLVALGAPLAEAPGSPAGCIRGLLSELLVAKQVDELPEHRQAALKAGRPEAVLFDDTRTRKAIPLLEGTLRACALLKEEADERNAALPGLGCESDIPLMTLQLVQELGPMVQSLIDHVRGAMGSDPPCGIAEFGKFRGAWAGRLREAGLSYAQIQLCLGYELSNEPAALLRGREAVRKSSIRARKRNSRAKPLRSVSSPTST